MEMVRPLDVQIDNTRMIPAYPVFESYILEKSRKVIESTNVYNRRVLQTLTRYDAPGVRELVKEMIAIGGPAGCGRRRPRWDWSDNTTILDPEGKDGTELPLAVRLGKMGIEDAQSRASRLEDSKLKAWSTSLLDYDESQFQLKRKRVKAAEDLITGIIVPDDLLPRAQKLT